jgi:hypothetical protein
MFAVKRVHVYTRAVLIYLVTFHRINGRKLIHYLICCINEWNEETVEAICCTLSK